MSFSEIVVLHKLPPIQNLTIITRDRERRLEATITMNLSHLELELMAGSGNGFGWCLWEKTTFVDDRA